MIQKIKISNNSIFGEEGEKVNIYIIGTLMK